MIELYAHYVAFVCLSPNGDPDFGSCAVRYPKAMLDTHADYAMVAQLISQQMPHKPDVTVLTVRRLVGDDKPDKEALTH